MNSTNITTHHCADCGAHVEEHCADHPAATIESIVSRSVTAEERLVAAYRAANPTSRVRSIVKLAINTGSRKQYCCVLCGEHGPTFAGGYKETKRSIGWRTDHVAAHVANIEEELVKLDAAIEGRTEP